MDLAADTTTTRREFLPKQARTRAGKARLLTLNDLDARTAAAREAHRLVDRLVADHGGEDAVSVGERQLAVRAALVGAIASDLEARWLAGQHIELGEYLTAVKTQTRVLATLGLKREAKQISWRDQWINEAQAADDTAVESNTAPAATAAVPDAIPDDGDQ